MRRSAILVIAESSVENWWFCFTPEHVGNVTGLAQVMQNAPDSRATGMVNIARGTVAMFTFASIAAKLKPKMVYPLTGGGFEAYSIQ